MEGKGLKNIYLMGIGGVGMGNLAGMLKDAGFVVRGSDRQIYSPMKEKLEEMNIEVKIGFSAQNLNPQPDLIVVGNVVTGENPEAIEMQRRGIPFISMPEALGRFFLHKRTVVVVAGTHGKTTSTAILGWLLASAGKDPGVFLGGVAVNFGSGYRNGKGEPFVIEGDEYDTAFFDKSPKFLHYSPRYLLLTVVEFDHGDIYRDMEEIKWAFRRLIGTLPGDGFIAYGAESPVAVEIVQGTHVQREAFGEGGAWRAKDIVFRNNLTEFTVLKNGGFFGRFRWGLPGVHNIRNCLGAIAIADRMGLSHDEIGSGIESFKGIRRRQEIIGEFNRILLIDDFAHHPTEVSETIQAVKARYPQRRLWAIFEPRSNTSRRHFFQESYPVAFKGADITVISGVFNPEAIKDGSLLAPDRIVKRIKQEGRVAFYREKADDIVKLVVENAADGDVILVMSNGNFGGIVDILKRELRLIHNSGKY